MKLLTKSITDQIPMLYATEEIPLDEKVIQCKFFTPDSSWTWFVVEGALVRVNGEEEPLTNMSDALFNEDPLLRLSDILFFGPVKGFELEWGYFSFKEICEVRGPLGLPVERDLYFGTPTWKDLKDRI